MPTTRRLYLVPILFAIVVAGIRAKADTLIFDLSAGSQPLSIGGSGGQGQGVFVSTTTTIDAFAFDIYDPNGSPSTTADLKYTIWDGTNAHLLFSQDVAGPYPSSGNQWVKTPIPFSFTLQAGNEYFFAIFEDRNIYATVIYPSITYSNNGLSADRQNAVYNGFSSPSFPPDSYGNGQIGLQLFEAQDVVPEPASLLLVGSGLLGLVHATRRRLRA